MMPVAQIDNNQDTESIIYLYTDHLMTNRLATDDTQQVVWRWEGEAFGNTPAEELGGVSVNLRFPGQYYDSESNLHYNHFRYYDPELGRYITSDPIGVFGGLNTYGYVNQNAIKFYDELGLLPKCVNFGTITDTETKTEAKYEEEHIRYDKGPELTFSPSFKMNKKGKLKPSTGLDFSFGRWYRILIYELKFERYKKSTLFVCTDIIKDECGNEKEFVTTNWQIEYTKWKEKEIDKKLVYKTHDLFKSL